MDQRKNEIAQRLLEIGGQFGRIKRQQGPVEGLKHSEIAVLYCVKMKLDEGVPGIKVSEISSMLRVTAPSVTQLIKSLEAKGYILRQASESDRRTVQIRLTEKGEDAIKTAMDALYETYVELVEYLGEEESIHLADLMEKVVTYFYTRSGKS